MYIFCRRLVFDVFNRYSGYIPLKDKMSYSLINFVEETVAKNADALITVSEKVLSTLQKQTKVLCHNYKLLRRSCHWKRRKEDVVVFCVVL
jgi:hypothetical protein